MSPRGLQGVPSRGNRVSKRPRDKALLIGYRELDVAPGGTTWAARSDDELGLRKLDTPEGQGRE